MASRCAGDNPKPGGRSRGGLLLPRRKPQVRGSGLAAQKPGDAWRGV